MSVTLLMGWNRSAQLPSDDIGQRKKAKGHFRDADRRKGSKIIKSRVCFGVSLSERGPWQKFGERIGSDFSSGVSS